MSLAGKLFGQEAESAAEQYLRRRGYRIRDRNVRSIYGELDLVAEQAGVVVFVEVKARRTDVFGGAPYAVDSRKQAKIIRLAAHYLAQHRLRNQPCRFDVLLCAGESVDPSSIQHVENAFEVPGNNYNGEWSGAGSVLAPRRSRHVHCRGASLDERKTPESVIGDGGVTEPMIQFFHVSKYYGGRLALSDINLQIEKGEFVLLMGASGAGKTTLLKLLFGSERPDEGQVFVQNRNVGRLKASEVPSLRRTLGFVLPGLSLAAEKDGLRQRRHAIDGTGRVAPEHTTQSPGNAQSGRGRTSQGKSPGDAVGR